MPIKRKRTIYTNTNREVDSVDNLLPEANAEIGLVGENEVSTATDMVGSERLLEAGQAGGGGSGGAPKA